ncbi:Pyrophosphate-fructose-6-phosphate-phosphotransferase alpha1 [Heracleum sosnowskyi]|uniref:Pyrophosphate-fructose-6-phosphate-phosphotransferase alpha1 n=1 Tax=Heracleum sosnowskyi TaxID=360622 RepID=A0AAD8GWA8_9APIA|nr:Pyrophosphate-fructose-6-phosphate-phosphotransferase alpha1 [Heracleum sosnowskyi]
MTSLTNVRVRLQSFAVGSDASLKCLRFQKYTMVGVVFCGRQSPIGHNVILGLHNALKTHSSSSTLLRFLGGCEGLFAQKTLEITDDSLATYKSQALMSKSGYDLLGRTKDKIRTTEQVNAALAACKAQKLDNLFDIGGLTSNTEAKCPKRYFCVYYILVVGVPVILNGDLKNQFVEANIGFDTIFKVDSQIDSNDCTDALLANKKLERMSPEDGMACSKVAPTLPF